MKITTNELSEIKPITTWSEAGGCVITTLAIQASVTGEENAKILAELCKASNVYLTLSSAPVRAVQPDAKKKPGPAKGSHRRPKNNPGATCDHTGQLETSLTDSSGKECKSCGKFYITGLA